MKAAKKNIIESDSEETRPRLDTIETGIINDYRRLYNEAVEMGINPETVKHAWIKSEKSSLFVKNPGFDDGGLKTKEISVAIDNVLKKYSIRKPPIVFNNTKSNKAIKVTISDSHVGMNPDDNGLFQYEYNGDVFMSSMDSVKRSVLKEFNTHGTFDFLLLDDLGDSADGWNGYTTRGGHNLPQNMTNSEVFECFIDAKVNLICDLVDSHVANKVIVRSVVNDNHSGSFAEVINIAIKKIINLLYKKDVVEIDILTRFLEHRIYGEHCFILTHGKDAKHMKSGLPLILNPKVVNFITDYIEHYEINSKFIHVEKGDLHQIGYQRVKRFDYRNFMSFAPPSAWVQHNFGDGYSGYSIQVIPKDSNEISHTDYFLEYRKK